MATDPLVYNKLYDCSAILDGTEIFKGTAKGDGVAVWTPNTDSNNTVSQSADGSANTINFIRQDTGEFSVNVMYSSRDVIEYIIRKKRENDVLSFSFVDSNGIEIVNTSMAAIQGEPEFSFGNETSEITFVILVGKY